MSDIGIQSAGYTNSRFEAPPAPFPQSQSFATVTPITLHTASGTSNWVTIPLSGLIPNDSGYVYIYAEIIKNSSGNAAANLEVRRDGQPDSAVYRVTRIVQDNGDYITFGTFGIVPITTGAARTFDVRMDGTYPNSSDWRIELRGYSSHTRNTADAQSNNESSGGSGSGGSGPELPVFP